VITAFAPRRERNGAGNAIQMRSLTPPRGDNAEGGLLVVEIQAIASSHMGRFSRRRT